MKLHYLLVCGFCLLLLSLMGLSMAPVNVPGAVRVHDRDAALITGGQTDCSFYHGVTSCYFPATCPGGYLYISPPPIDVYGRRLGIFDCVDGGGQSCGGYEVIYFCYL